MTKRWNAVEVGFSDDDAEEWAVGTAVTPPEATGKCPRCADDLTITLDGLPGGSEIDETIECDCDCENGEHPGRPPGRTRGCGASWRMRLRSPRDDLEILAPTTTASVRRIVGPNVPWTTNEVEFNPTSWSVGPDGSTARGYCPTCFGEFDVEIVFETIVIAAADEPVDAVQIWTCACSGAGHAHPDRPSDTGYGCGSYWPVHLTGPRRRLQLSIPDDVKRIDDARAVYWATRGSNLSSAEGGLAKTAAGLQEWREKWLPGVASVQAVLGLASVALFRDATRSFSDGDRALVFGLIVAATAAAVTALIVGYRAAYGWPRKVSVATADDQRAAARIVAEQTSKAAGRFLLALMFAGASVALLLIALGMVWFGRPVSPTVKVTYATGGTPPQLSDCGEIILIDRQRVVLKVTTPAAVEVRERKLSGVLNIAPDSC